MRSLFRSMLSPTRHPDPDSYRDVSGSPNVFSITSLSSRITVLFLSLLFSLSVFAQPPRPSPQRAVNNLSTQFPNYLSANETAELERRLENFSNETTNQICVVIIDSLWAFSTADLAERIITTWGVGMKGKNNGVVILIKPTGGAGERDAFIGTGYGLEGAIPDAVCKRIVDNELIPGLKAGDPYKGINDAVTVIMALAKGDYNEKDYRKKIGKGGKDLFSWSNLLILIVVIVIISRIFKKSGFSSYTGSGRYMGGGGFGGFGGGSSGGGGGWGGFGGGSGGGGGAGGKW